jgi:hypothetical protein
MEKLEVSSLPFSLTSLAKVLVFVAICIVAFFTPFSLGHPQWLVGTVVNTCLFLSAIFLPKKYFILLAILPSLGVLARGLVFGPFTFFLFYFLPFIWIGNLLLILTFKKFGFVVASFSKFLFLYLVANIYFNFNIVPKIFLTSMGLNQLATALVGGIIAFTIFKIYGQFKLRS